MPQRMIHQHDGEHRLGNRRRTNRHAGVVAAKGFDHHFFVADVNATTRRTNAGGRLDRHTRHNVLAGCNTTQNTARVIAQKTLWRNLIAMFSTALGDRIKTGADFHALHGIDTHQRMRQIGIEAVVHRLPPTRRHATRSHRDTATHRVALFTQRIHIGFELRHDAIVRRKKRVVTNIVGGNKWNFNRTQLVHPALNGDAITLKQPLAGNRTRRNTDGRFTRRRAATTAVIPRPVLLPIGVIGMPRAELLGDVAVILAALVRITNQQANRRTRGFALEDARQNFHCIRLATLRDVARRTRLATIQFGLNIRFANRQPRRTTIHHAANRRPVGFAKRRDGKQGADCVSGHNGDPGSMRVEEV